MTEKLKQKIQEEMLNLPKEMQDAINSFDWGKISEDIGKKYLIDESEINDFQVITGLVLVGIIDIDSYARYIEDEIGVAEEDAGKIANEGIENIFNPLVEKFEENVKNRMMGRDQKWDQNLDFILSGGDYSAFMEKRAGSPKESNISDYMPKQNTPNNTTNTATSNTPSANPAKNIPTIEDIRRKLII